MSSSVSAASVLRIGSIAVALWEYLCSFSFEVRLFASQRSFKPSRLFVLFLANRYFAIATLIVSNIGYWGVFSTEACGSFHHAAPIMKVFADFASHTIIAIRTYAVSRKAPWVKWTIGAAIIACTAVQLFVNSWHQIAVQSPMMNCTSGNPPHHHVIWVHYLASMLFDLLCLAISSTYLLLDARGPLRIDAFSRLMLEQGLLYFGVIVAVNTVNVVLFQLQNPRTQSSGVTLAYVFTWIMSQRILIELTGLFPRMPTPRPASRAPSRKPSQVAISQNNSQFGGKDTETGYPLGFPEDFTSPASEDDDDPKGRSFLP